MAHWDQVFQFKNALLERGEITQSDLQDMYRELDIATTSATAEEKLKVLVQVVKERNLHFLLTADRYIEVQDAFQLAYLLKVFCRFDVYESEFKDLFGDMTEIQRKKWKAIGSKRSLMLKSLRRLNRALEMWISRMEVKGLLRDLGNMK